MSTAPCRTPLRAAFPANVIAFPEPEPGTPDAALIPEPPSFPIAQMQVCVEWQRICEVSGREEKFVAYKQCKVGLIGCCTHCGEERIAPFTRTGGVE